MCILLFSLDADNVRRVDFRRIFVGWIFDRFLTDSQQMFDLFAIDVRRMDYRCSIDVRWKCPSFLPSLLPSFVLPSCSSSSVAFLMLRLCIFGAYT